MKKGAVGSFDWIVGQKKIKTGGGAEWLLIFSTARIRFTRWPREHACQRLLHVIKNDIAKRFDADVEANTTTLGSCATAVCNPNINTSDNRFSSGQGYSYDLNGNVRQDATGQRFGYDAENHQKEFFAVGNASSTPDATYQYDGDGKRVKKTSATETTVFVYNASGQLVAEYSTQIAQTPQVSYLTTDHLGSPRVITNENGAVTKRQDYAAFGDETFTAQRTSGLKYTAPDEIRKGYTGYEKDDESGLDFAQARYYNSTHGRYTSIDPLTASVNVRNPQTFNRYSYVLNSPYKFTDPLGLLPVSIACGQWCSNSGPYVDGSAFRGRDASFDWTEQRAVPPTPPPTVLHEAMHASAAQQNAETSQQQSSVEFVSKVVELRSWHPCY